MKSIRKCATPAEEAKLTSLLVANQALKDDLKYLRHEIEQDEEEKFWERALHVLFGTASSQEIKYVRSIRERVPSLWRRFIEFGFIIQVGGESAALESKQPKTPAKMPDDIRKRLLAQIAQDQLHRVKQHT